MTTKNLKICHVKAQSIFAHLDEFRAFFASAHYHHIIAVSESWLKQHVTDEMVSLAGYSLLCRDRNCKGGGGLAIYYHNFLKARVFRVSSDTYCHRPEILIAEFETPSAFKLLVGLVYRPSRLGFLDEFEGIFALFINNYKHAIILGDLNSNLLRDSFNARHLRSFLHDIAFSIVPLGTTYHVGTSQSWLDICAVNDMESILSHGQVGVPFLSGHDLIFIDFAIKTYFTDSRTMEFYDFRNVDTERLREQLATTDWSAFFVAGEIDEKIAVFNDCFQCYS